MTDTLYHERQFSTDYLFSLNYYYNQRSSRLPGQQNYMEDFTPLAQRCSQKLEKKMFWGRKVNIWRRFIFPHEFLSKDLEKLFQMYAYPFCFDGLRCLLILMIALTVSLSIVNFVFVSRLSLENIANSSLCLSFVVILICLHTRFMTQRLVPVVTILIVMLCLVFCAVSFAVDEQTLSPGFDHKINPRRIMSGGFTFSRVEAVWRLCYVTFVLYAFVPLKFYLPVVFGLFVALIHSLLAVFLPSYQPNMSPVLSKQVIANMFLFLMVNMVCAYLYRAREKEMRFSFNQIRSSTALQLQLQDENDKADKLLASMIPASIALEMKGDLQTPHLRDFFQKVYMERHENVSILFADLTGLSILTSQCSALELVRFLNEAMGRFDQLAAENHCQRIQLQGGRYFCVSGILDQRTDHAKCCVEMGIDLIDFMSFVANLTTVNLRMRVGVHSGQVTCGVVGVGRWQYDVWSDDVEVASLTEKAGQPGKVLVTSATLDHLQEEFPAVANRNNCSKLEARGVKTFFVISEHPRKHYFLPKSASNSCTKNIGGVLSAIKFNVEQPLSNVVSRTLNFVSSNNSFDDAEVFITSKSKKSSSSFSDRHRKHLIHVIGNKSVKKKKTEHVNYLSLSFKSSALERSFKALEDVQFASKLFISLILLVVSMIIHALILPRTIFLLVFFLVCFAWISVVLMLVLGYRIRCIGCDVKKSFLARRSIILVCILLHFVMSFLNTLCCRGGIVFPDRVASLSESVVSFHHPSHLECLSPQYIYLNALPCFFLVFLFARLSVSAKLSIWLLMCIGYLMIMEFANRTFFFNYDSKLGSEIPSDAPGILMLLHFVIALYLSSRDLDWLLRLGHIWQDQVRKQRLEVNTMENLNQDLFHNLLPDHVVPYFDNVPENKIIDFYSHSCSRVTVMQASVTNMSQAHGELMKRSRPSESLRVLHEIISAFDKVHMDPRFMSTVKIKSSGPSYLVVGGLKPNNKIDDSKENKKLHLNIIMELALKMREALLPISRGRLMFRAGVDLGPAIAGVIGARKPQYEIIGDCVNTACLLNSTSLPNCIQVSQTVYEVLQGCYEFKCRGMTKLKSSREHLTYFLSGAHPSKPTSFFDFEKDEEFLPSPRYNIGQDKFTELPAFDHSIKRPQPITPQTPSKAHGGSQMFNFSSINNPGYFHHHNDSLSAFSSSIQPSVKSTELHWNQCDRLEFQNPNQFKKISGTSDSRSHFVLNSQNPPINTALHGPLQHISAFIPAGGLNANTVLSGNGKTLPRMTNFEDFNESHVNKKPNDGNNNSYPDHMHPCNPNCSQSYETSPGTGIADCQSWLCSQTSSEKTDENIDASDFWRSESNFCERKPSNKDREIETDTKVTPKNSVRLSTSDVEDIEAIMKEIGANQNKKSELYLSEEQDRSNHEVNATEMLSSDQKDEGGLMHLENGIIYTKKFVDSSRLKSSGHVACSSQIGASLYDNVSKMRSSGKKVQERDKPNTKLLAGANGFLKTSGPVLQNPPKSAFIIVRNNTSNAGLKSQPNQNSRAPLQNGTNASLAKTLLAANLNSKLRLHQQSLKKSEPTKPSQQHEGTNSRHSMAVPPQNLRDRWGHTDSPTRSKSLDRIVVELSDELNSSSSIGESSPKMLQRTSNKRDIASLCANGSSGSENQKQLGSGLLQVKYPQKSKARNNPMHLTSVADRLSLSSFNSEMSRSDPALSYESSSAIESEYDNYRPGMASDEDYFAVEPVSDVEIDIFDDANVDNVKVEEDYENYNFDSLMSGQSSKMTAEL